MLEKLTVRKESEPRRHLALLICILLLFTVTPFVRALGSGVFLLNVSAAAVLTAGSYTLIRQRSLFVIALVLCAISIFATWRLLLHPRHATIIFAHACVTVMLAFFSVTILGYVLREGRVTMDRIFAAICVYMMMGYAWTFGYALLEEIQPGSFSAGASTSVATFFDRVLELRYLSFMTLTTVGYGDVVPRLPLARTLCMLEAVVGQIYLTVLVARLVGLHIVHRMDESQDRRAGRKDD